MNKPEETTSCLYEFDDFRLLPDERLLLYDNQSVQLPPKVFDTLAFLVENAGHLVEKDELLEKLWAETFVEEATLARNVSLLRKILSENSAGRKFIETVPKRGYRFVEPVRRLPTTSESGEIAGVFAVEKAVEIPAKNEAVEKQISEPKPALPIPHPLLWLLLIVGFTGALFASLSFWSAGAKKTSNLKSVKSVAVMPFKNLTGDGEQEYLADGMTESLIAALSKIRRLKVISRSSVSGFKNSETEPREIGDRLNVEAILEGSLRQRGDSLRIELRLVNTADGSVLWAGESYEREITKIIELQDEISRGISAQFGDEQNFPPPAQTTNSEAYEKFLRGKFHQSERTEQNLNKALEFYEQALALDPNFAEAHAALADVYLLFYNYGFRSPEDAVPKAKQALNRALQLNPNLPDAYATLAQAQFLYDRNWTAAERSLRRAIELNPNDAVAYLRYGWYLIALGRFDEAAVRLETARNLNPLSSIVRTNIGMVYQMSRRYPEAIEQFQKVVAESPYFSLPRELLAECYDAIGDGDAAFYWYMRTLELEGEPELAKKLETIKQTRGLQAAYQTWLDESLKVRKNGRLRSLRIASIYAALRNREQTLGWLEKARDEHEPVLWQIKFVARYDFLRSDSRFQGLLKQIEPK